MIEGGELPGVQPQTYVIFRCNRWGTYSRWIRRTGITTVEPQCMDSWWRLWLDGNVAQDRPTGKDVCPVNVDEALETRRCVLALPAHLKNAVIEEYVKRGVQREKAAALGIEERQYRNRLAQAHAILLELFNLSAAGLPLEVDYKQVGRPPK